MWDIIIYQYIGFNGGLTNPPLKLGMIEWLHPSYMEITTPINPCHDVDVGLANNCQQKRSPF